MEFVLANWEYFLIGFMVLEKVVKLSAATWDDILVDGIKSILTNLVKKK